jgi:CheY-like chemotaxis protein
MQSVGIPTAIKTLLSERCPLKILVAEDDLINQRVYQMMLKQMGYKATFVTNGLEAVITTKRTPIDLILMDIQMPVMNGLEAAAKICEIHPQDCRPYMIALTASAMEEDKKLCLEAGMNEFLTKPLRYEALTTTLEEAFARIH